MRVTTLPLSKDSGLIQIRRTDVDENWRELGVGRVRWNGVTCPGFSTGQEVDAAVELFKSIGLLVINGGY